MSFLELLKQAKEEAAQIIEKKKVDHDKDGQSHPEKYFTGLDEKTKIKREKEIEERKEEGIKPPQLYEDLPGDKDAKTEPSKYTKTEGAQKVREETKDNSKEEFIRASSKVSGVAKDIIEEVYDKGLKAWSTSGHRPGATAQQWAIARVYAFLFDAKSGARKADQHLWDKHLNAKKSIESDAIINDKAIYNIKQQIVKALKYGLKQTKNKYHTPKLAKNAEKLLKNDKLYLSDFEFCFNNLKHRNDPNKLDFWLLGGDGMIQLQKYINDSITLQEALDIPYEETKNE